MIIEQYVNDNMPGYEVTVVTLEEGESHEWGGFVSRNAGHVFAMQTPYDTRWTEYDLNDPLWVDAVSQLKAKGWKKH
jgi:hypothetical protein